MDSESTANKKRKNLKLVLCLNENDNMVKLKVYVSRFSDGGDGGNGRGSCLRGEEVRPWTSRVARH